MSIKFAGIHHVTSIDEDPNHLCEHLMQRAELLDGSFEVTSKSDRGAVVGVRLPLV